MGRNLPRGHEWDRSAVPYRRPLAPDPTARSDSGSVTPRGLGAVHPAGRGESCRGGSQCRQRSRDRDRDGERTSLRRPRQRSPVPRVGSGRRNIERRRAHVSRRDSPTPCRVVSRSRHPLSRNGAARVRHGDREPGDGARSEHTCGHLLGRAGDRAGQDRMRGDRLQSLWQCPPECATGRPDCREPRRRAPCS